MSWFILKDQECREERVGIWLRHESPEMEDVVRAIKKSGNMRLSDWMMRVVVHELRPDGRVMLQVWCKSLVDSLRRKHRYNVFNVVMDENPEWICEGDLGKGLT